MSSVGPRLSRSFGGKPKKDPIFIKIQRKEEGERKNEKVYTKERAQEAMREENREKEARDKDRKRERKRVKEPDAGVLQESGIF